MTMQTKNSFSCKCQFYVMQTAINSNDKRKQIISLKSLKCLGKEPKSNKQSTYIDIERQNLKL